MVKLRQDNNGNYIARKRLPDDVREEYGGRYKARYEAPRNDGVIAVLFAVMFLVGVTLGGVLSEHETKQAQITSIEEGATPIGVQRLCRIPAHPLCARAF